MSGERKRGRRALHSRDEKRGDKAKEEEQMSRIEEVKMKGLRKERRIGRWRRQRRGETEKTWQSMGRGDNK